MSVLLLVVVSSISISISNIK